MGNGIMTVILGMLAIVTIFILLTAPSFMPGSFMDLLWFFPIIFIALSVAFAVK